MSSQVCNEDQNLSFDDLFPALEDKQKISGNIACNNTTATTQGPKPSADMTDADAAGEHPSSATSEPIDIPGRSTGAGESSHGSAIVVGSPPAQRATHDWGGRNNA